jgi:hypothetical protein
MPRHALLVSLLALLLWGCESGAPPCAGVSPAHVTTEGVAQTGPLVVGQTAEEVILLQTSALSGVTESVHEVIYQVTEDDSGGDCEMELDCGPDELEVGQDITCDLTNTAGSPGCAWTAEVVVTITHHNPDVCTDVTLFHDIEAEGAAR